MAGARDAEAQEPPPRALVVLAVAALGDLRLLERAPGAQHLQTPAAAGCRARAFRDEACNRARQSDGCHLLFQLESLKSAFYTSVTRGHTFLIYVSVEWR